MRAAPGLDLEGRVLDVEMPFEAGLNIREDLGSVTAAEACIIENQVG